MKKEVKKVGKYNIYKQNKLYEDQFSSIYVGKHREAHFPVIVHQINRKQFEKEQQLEQEFKRKVSHVRNLQSKVLSKCYQISATDHHYYIVLEQIKVQTLQKKLLTQPLNIEDLGILLNCFREFFQEMKRLRSFHGHISPNIIHVGKLKAKIQLINFGNFGLINKITKNNLSHSLKINQNENLVFYPPQVLKYNEFSQKTDCWSFGVIVYKSIYGRLPWELKGKTVNQFINQVVDLDVKFPSNVIVSRQLHHLIYGCLKSDEDLRFSYDDILTHEIFKMEIVKKPRNSCQSHTTEFLQSISSMKTVNQYENTENSSRIKN